MGFFSRKSKDPNPVNDAVNRSIKEAEQQQETQIKLVEVRKTKEDIDNDFFDLVTSREVAEKSHKAAQANEIKLEKLEQADAANKATGKENVSKLWEMEKDIYIIPGGYAEAPSETNDVPRNNLDVYNRAVEQLARQYKVKTPAEAVETGADQLYPYIKKYVNSLRSAIESGRAMKANACIDMLRYVLNIGYRYEDAATPEKFNERVKKRSILWRTPAATFSVTSTTTTSFWETTSWRKPPTRSTSKNLTGSWSRTSATVLPKPKKSSTISASSAPCASCPRATTPENIWAF